MRSKGERNGWEEYGEKKEKKKKEVGNDPKEREFGRGESKRRAKKKTGGSRKNEFEREGREEEYKNEKGN